MAATVYAPTSPLRQQFVWAEENGAQDFWFLIEPTNVDEKIALTKPAILKAEFDTLVPTKRITSMRFQKKGNILIHCKDNTTAYYISLITKILDINVKTKCFEETFTSRFILRDIHQDVSLHELCNELESENDFNVREIRRFKKGQALSETILVTILGTEIPDSVKLWYQRIKISTFFDKPTICQSCWKLGHPAKYCPSPNKCYQCGQPKTADHKNPCDANPLCPNCGGSHPATDKSCQAYLEFSNLIQYKTQNHLPLAEARRLFNTKKTSTYASKSKIDNSNYMSRAEIKEYLDQFSQNIAQLIESTYSKQINALTAQITNLTQAVQAIVSAKTITNSNQITNLPTNATLESPLKPGIRKKSPSPTKAKKKKKNNPNSPNISDEDENDISDCQSTISNSELKNSLQNMDTTDSSLYDTIKLRNRISPNQ